MRRAWAVVLTGTDGLQHPGVPYCPVWTHHVLSMWRDKGLAKLVASGYGDGHVERVAANVPRTTKNCGAWYAWSDPQEPPRGLLRGRLRRILTRRASFGGRKGRRAAARLKEMTR